MGRTKVKQANGKQTLMDILGSQMDFLLPSLREDGTRTGLSQAGHLAAGQARESLQLTRLFGPEMIALQSKMRQQAIQADPLARASQAASLETIANRRELSNDLIDRAESGLEDLDNDGLPDDVNRSILEQSRSSLAARGINESGAGSTLEALKLVGGREQLRSSRLGQAQSILSGAAPLSTPGLALASPAGVSMISGQGFFPGANTLAGFAGQSMGVQQQAFSQQAGLRFQENAALGQGIGQLAGGIFGFGT